MTNNGEKSTTEKLDLILEAIQEKKGKELISINLENIHNSISDYFVICHGTSTTQVDAIVDEVQQNLKQKAGIIAHHVEGTDNCQWVLMDYFEILVHIFLEEKRNFYNLEELWADGKIEKIEDVT